MFSFVRGYRERWMTFYDERKKRLAKGFRGVIYHALTKKNYTFCLKGRGEEVRMHQYCCNKGDISRFWEAFISAQGKTTGKSISEKKKQTSLSGDEETAKAIPRPKKSFIDGLELGRAGEKGR